MQVACRAVEQFDLVALGRAYVPGKVVGVQPVGFFLGEVASGNTVGADHDLLAGGIKREIYFIAIFGDGESDVVAVIAVAFAPAFIHGHLEFVVPGGNIFCQKGVDAVTVAILHPAAQAVGLPVSGATQLPLEVTRNSRNRTIDVVGNPVGFVIIEKLHGAAVIQQQRNIGTVAIAVEAIVFAPAVVECGLVFPVAGRHLEYTLPLCIVLVIRKQCGRTLRLPVARAAKHFLQVTGDIHLARGGCIGGIGLVGVENGL